MSLGDYIDRRTKELSAGGLNRKIYLAESLNLQGGQDFLGTQNGTGKITDGNGHEYKAVYSGNPSHRDAAVKLNDTTAYILEEGWKIVGDDVFGGGLFILEGVDTDFYIQKIGSPTLYSFDPFLISGMDILGINLHEAIRFSPNGKHLFCAGRKDDVLNFTNSCTLHWGYIKNFQLEEGLVPGTGTVTGAITQGTTLITTPDTVSTTSPPGGFTTDFDHVQVSSGFPDLCVNGGCPGANGGSLTSHITGSTEFTLMPNQSTWNQPNQFFNLLDSAWILYDTDDGLLIDFTAIYQAQALDRKFMDVTRTVAGDEETAVSCFCCNGPHCLGGFASFTCITTQTVEKLVSGITGPPLPIVSRDYTQTDTTTNGGNGVIPNPCPPGDTDCAGPRTCSVNGTFSSVSSHTNFAGATQWTNGSEYGRHQGSGALGNQPMTLFKFSANSDNVVGLMSMEDLEGGGGTGHIRNIYIQSRTSFIPMTESEPSSPGVVITSNYIHTNVVTTTVFNDHTQQIGFSYLKGYRGKTNPGAMIVVKSPFPLPASLHRYTPYMTDESNILVQNIIAFDDVNIYTSFPADPDVVTAKSLSRTVIESIKNNTTDITVARWNKDTFTSIFSKAVSLTVPIPLVPSTIFPFAIVDFTTLATGV